MKYYWIVAWLLFTLTISCTSVNLNSTSFQLDNPKVYYSETIDDIREKAKPYIEPNAPYFYFKMGSISFIIVERDSDYKIYKINLSLELSKTENSGNRPATYTHKVTVFLMGKKFQPLNDLFSYSSDRVIYYDISFKPNTVRLHIGVISALFDRNNQIKFVFNQDTMLPTQNFCHKKYKQTIPLSAEQMSFLWELAFCEHTPSH